MDNPVNQITSAAKSAFNLKNILVLVFGLLVINAILDLAGFSAWLWQPVTTFKAWNAARTAKN